MAGVCSHVPEAYCPVCRPDLAWAPNGWYTDAAGTWFTPYETRSVEFHGTPTRHQAASKAIAGLLTALDTPRNEHTAGTPDRVAKAFIELLSGYDEDPSVHLERTFPGPDDAGVVVCSGIRFTSLCAHHLLPFTGKATVAYLPGPGEPIVGLSKLARVLEGYARRLQTQEMLGSEVADALVEKLNPMGAACIITSAHACMGIRGVKQPDAVMTTSSLRGAFRDNSESRAELMSLHRAEL
jgi:GTP cyclohydrolase I